MRYFRYRRDLHAREPSLLYIAILRYNDQLILYQLILYSCIPLVMLFVRPARRHGGSSTSIGS